LPFVQRQREWQPRGIIVGRGGQGIRIQNHIQTIIARVPDQSVRKLLPPAFDLSSLFMKVFELPKVFHPRLFLDVVFNFS